MKKRKFHFLGLLLVLTGIFAFMFVLNHYTPIFFDDFRYSYSFATGDRLLSFSQIIPSMQNHYYSLNGRLLLHFLAQAFIIIGDNAFDIINSLAFVALILVINYHATGTFRSVSIKNILLIFFVLWIATPAFGESFLWLIGSANYLFGILIFLICLIPYRFFYKEYKKQSAVKNIFLCVLTLLCGVIGAYTNENLSVSFFVIQICFIAAYIINGYKFRIWMAFSFIGNIAGTAFLMSSPSYVQRSDVWKTSLTDKVIIAVKNIPWVTITFIQNLWIPLCVALFCAALFVFLNSKNVKFKDFYIKHKHKINLSLVYLIAFIVWNYSAVLCDYFPQRAYTSAIAFILIFSLILIKDIDIDKPAFNAAALLAAGVIFIGSCVPGFLDVKTVKYKYDERQTAIHQTIEKGEKTIELSPIESETKYSEFYLGGDISESAQWINNMMAEYYGLDSITVKDAE